ASASSFLLLTSAPPRSALFPYTTLFRSAAAGALLDGVDDARSTGEALDLSAIGGDEGGVLPAGVCHQKKDGLAVGGGVRGGGTADRESTHPKSSHCPHSHPPLLFQQKKP